MPNQTFENIYFWSFRLHKKSYLIFSLINKIFAKTIYIYIILFIFI